VFDPEGRLGCRQCVTMPPVNSRGFIRKQYRGKTMENKRAICPKTILRRDSGGLCGHLVQRQRPGSAELEQIHSLADRSIQMHWLRELSDALRLSESAVKCVQVYSCVDTATVHRLL